MKRQRKQFAICIDNREYPASLERWKVYLVLPDRAAERHHLIRVVDESGEDYLYPRAYFRAMKLPSPIRRLYPSKTKAVA
jgi:hypothetical protein